MGRRARHWKQLWDPNAKFVWRKRLLFNGKHTEVGKAVTKKQRQTLGVNRLRRWWDAGVIEIDPKTFEPGKRKAATPKAKEPREPRPQKLPVLNPQKRKKLREGVE